MMAYESMVAKRYAKAFMNVYGERIARDHYYALVSLENFLKEHKQLFFVFKLSHVTEQTKLQALRTLFEQVKLDQLLMPLATVLVKSKRVSLLPDIIKYLVIIYKERAKIMSWVITSSHPLSTHDVDVIQNFLARQTGYDSIYKQVIDPALIAGIRLQSDTLLWEYSIRKQLAHVGLPLIR